MHYTISNVAPETSARAYAMGHGHKEVERSSQLNQMILMVCCMSACSIESSCRFLPNVLEWVLARQL